MQGEMIRKYRLNKNMSQQQLADQVNVVRQTISKWEKGLSVPDPDTMMKIAEILDLPTETLMENDTYEIRRKDRKESPDMGDIPEIADSPVTCVPEHTEEITSDHPVPDEFSTKKRIELKERTAAKKRRWPWMLTSGIAGGITAAVLVTGVLFTGLPGGPGRLQAGGDTAVPVQSDCVVRTSYIEGKVEDIAGDYFTIVQDGDSWPDDDCSFICVTTDSGVDVPEDLEEGSVVAIEYLENDTEAMSVVTKDDTMTLDHVTELVCLS